VSLKSKVFRAKYARNSIRCLSGVFICEKFQLAADGDPDAVGAYPRRDLLRRQERYPDNGDCGFLRYVRRQRRKGRSWGAGEWAGRPFWRYVGPNSDPASPWLTRGLGWKPPYGTDFGAAKDALQMPYMPTGIKQVSVSWWEPIIGPRQALKYPKYGAAVADWNMLVVGGGRDDKITTQRTMDILTMYFPLNYGRKFIFIASF
jgi:hypothetical protein